MLSKKFYIIASDMTNYCNARCIFCYNDFNKYHTSIDMNETTFSKILQLLSCTDLFLFSCNYEPTIHKDFNKLLEKVPDTDENTHTLLTTNLAKQMSDNDIQALANSNISQLNVSLETFDLQLYEKLVGITPNYFFKNLDKIAEIFTNSKTTPKFGFLTMVIRDNFNELIDIAKKALDKYSPDVHEFRVPYFGEYLVNETFNDQLLHMDEILDIKDKLLAISSKIVFSTYNATTIENLERHINAQKNINKITKSSNRDLYTIFIDSAGNSSFPGDDSFININDIETPLSYFNQKLIKLQEYEASMFSITIANRINISEKSRYFPGILKKKIIYNERFFYISGFCSTFSNITKSKLFLENNQTAFLVNMDFTELQDDLFIETNPYIMEFRCVVDLSKVGINNFDIKFVHESDGHLVSENIVWNNNQLHSFKYRFIYGTGALSKLCYLEITKEDISINGFIVSDSHFQSSDFLGHKINRLSEIPCSANDICIILALNECNVKEVLPSLLELGYITYYWYIKE